MTHSQSKAPRTLIIGAGPSGLALAIELGHRDIPCLVVERNARVGYAPRAKTTHVRTREHFRRWGIADKLAAASPLGIDYPSDVAFVTRLNGHELTRFQNSFNCAPEKNALYAEHAQWIPQYTLEEVMRSHAQSLPGVEVRFNCEHLSFAQQGDRIVSQLHDSGLNETFTVETDYLVGADGSRSRIRDAIGATMHGRRDLSRNYNIIFRAPGLAEAHPHGRCVMYWQVNPDMPSLIGPMDRDDRWFFMPTKLPADVTFSDEQAVAAIKLATGIELPYEILSSDDWIANSLIADKYRQGRVFLTGDACHLHPPFGGFGMFLGILDSVDLGWKMAAVLQGQGGPALLDSYEPERKSVHEYVVAEAVGNHQVLTDQFVQPGIEAASETGQRLRAEVGERIQALKAPEFRSLGVVLGYRYEHSPIIVSDGSAQPPRESTLYTPSSCPGCRAPHVWLEDGSALYDHFGPDFTLLVTSATGEGFQEQLCEQASRAGVSVALLTLDEPEVAALYPKRFTLIRPDQHVAWRGDEWASQALKVLRQVAGYSQPIAAGAVNQAAPAR